MTAVPVNVGVEEPCGAMVVVEFDHGYEAGVKWCARTNGPCPFPGAPKAALSERLCATSPTRRLRVMWADESADKALRHLLIVQNQESGECITWRAVETLAVAADALRMCGGDENRGVPASTDPEEPF